MLRCAFIALALCSCNRAPVASDSSGTRSVLEAQALNAEARAELEKQRADGIAALLKAKTEELDEVNGRCDDIAEANRALNGLANVHGCDCALRERHRCKSKCK